jgi:hypothetical protein
MDINQISVRDYSFPSMFWHSFSPGDSIFLCSLSPREAMNNHIFNEYLAKLPKKLNFSLTGHSF